MDLVGACRVFVHVGDRGSVTLGAAAARVPQPVATRRIQALERHLGEALFDRSARRAVLTPFGRDLLPAARRLMMLADALEADASEARLRPFTLAVPLAAPIRSLASLTAAAKLHGRVVEFRHADPREREELLRIGCVGAALVAVPSDEARWRIPLGVADDPDRFDSGSAGSSRHVPTGTTPLRLATLRPRRGASSRPRIHLQPEDDVPHLRDVLERSGHAAGLVPSQISTETSLAAAVAATFDSEDLVLCSAAEAETVGLRWRPLAQEHLHRGYSIAGEAGLLSTGLASAVAHCLGQPTREHATTETSP